jgi:hypothetical protein
MNKNELIDAAVELNQVFGLEPPINLLLNEEDLICKIIDAMTLANEDDEFSQTTVQTLVRINPVFIDKWQGDGLSDGDDDWIRAGRKSEKAVQGDQIVAKVLGGNEEHGYNQTQ